LGDAVLLAHVFPRFTRLATPGEPICLVLRHDAAKMAFLFRGQASVECVDYDRFQHSFLFRRATMKRLGATRWRIVIDTDFLRHPLRDERLVKKLKADEKLAMEPRAWPKYDRQLARNRAIYSRLFESGPDHLDKVVRWSNFANWIAGTGEPPPTARLPDERLPTPAAPTGRPFVVLIPFSAVPGKQSLPDVFIDIVRRLPSEIDVVVAGAPDDPAKNPDFVPLLALPRVRYEASDFERLAPRLRAARLVIAVDTAAMHLAVALGTRTLCLASAAYVNEIVPYAPEITPPNVRFLWTPIDCAGCLGNCILPPEENRFPCVARLPSEHVLGAVDHMLAVAAVR
jgi:ADP-heptose:LPS heptosyltransferase